MSALSERMQKKMSGEPSLLFKGFVIAKTNPYDAETNPGGVINLGTSENLTCSDLVIPKMESLAKYGPGDLTYFPPGGVPGFREELAKFLTEKARADTPLEGHHISITNGLSGAFSFLSFIVGEEGDEYLIGAPYYGMTCQYMGAYSGLRPVELTDGGSLEAMTTALQREEHRIKAIVLINPNNPTGEMYPKRHVLQVLELAKEHGLHVIIDEIYFLSVFKEDDFESCLSYSMEWPDPERTHFIWSFSKDFAMSGARCGVIYSKSEIVHRAYNEKMCFYHFVPGLVQRMLCNLIKDREWVERFLTESKHRLQAHLKIVTDKLQALSIPFLPPKGTLYVWADFTPVFKDSPSDEEAKEIFYGLIDEGVYIPSAKGFNGPRPQFYRIVFAVPERTLSIAMDRLATFVRRYKGKN